MAQAIKIPLTVIGYKEAREQLELINSTISKNKTATEDQIRTQKALEKALDQTDDAIKESVRQTDKLTDSYVRNEEGMLEVSATISKFEDQMYALALAGGENTDEFKALQKETAKFKSVIIQTDKEIDTLAENKGFGQIGIGLENVSSKLLSLDFAGAGKEASIMSANMGNLSKAGGAAIKGLTQTVKGLSSAFIKMGVALLANPIFLIVAAFVAIGVAIIAVLKKFGLLQPILDAVGKVLGWIGDVIDTVVQGFKDLTDWLGFTTNAADEFTQGQIDNTKKIQAANEKQNVSTISGLNHEIALRQANGEETIELELQVQKVIAFGAAQKLKSLEKEFRMRLRLGELTEEEIKELKKNITEQGELIKNARKTTEVLNATHNTKITTQNKEAYSKRLEDLNTFNQNRLEATQLIEDLELEIMQAGTVKTLTENELKYSRLIESTRENEALIAEEKAQVIALYEQIARDNEAQIIEEKKAADTLKKEQLAIDLQTSLDAAILADTEERNRHAALEDAKTAKAKEENDKRQADVKAAVAGGLMATTQALNAASDLANFLGDKKLAKLKKGSAAEIKQLKKNFEINKKIQIAQAVMQGIQATLAAYSSGAAIPVVGAVTGPLFAAFAAVTSAINIAKIKNSTFNGGGSAPTAPAPPSISAASISPPSEPATPSLSLFGQSNDLNNASETESQDAIQTINVNATVSETEITETQNNINQIEENAEL